MSHQKPHNLTAQSPVLSDGGSTRLHVGASAEAIGENERHFARLGDRPVLVDPVILNWTAVKENMDGNEIQLDGLSGNALDMLLTRVEELDFEACVQALTTQVGIDDQTARVLLLFEGFELDVGEIADELDISREAVNDELHALYEQYDEQRIIEEMQTRHPNRSETAIAAFVLAEGFRWDTDEVAAELGIAADEVPALLETGDEELEKSLQEVIQSRD